MNSGDNETKLDALFADYRESVPTPEPSTNFLPELWQKIEARRNEKVFALDTLFAEYRQAVPDPEPSSGFMPGLWKRIEARRNENVSIFRRFAQVCMFATAAITLAMVAITHIENQPVYSASYVDVLDAAHTVDSAQLMDSGDYQ